MVVVLMSGVSVGGLVVADVWSASRRYGGGADLWSIIERLGGGADVWSARGRYGGDD